MSLERAALLRNLPALRPIKWPMPTPALAVAYTGPGTADASVDDERWTTIGRDGAESFAVSLTGGLTLEGLAIELRRHAGYEVTVLGNGAVFAAAFVDDARRLVAEPYAFSIATNPIWHWAVTIAQRLTRAAARIDIAMQQLNLLRAAGSFADYWGSYTATTRKPPVRGPIATGTIEQITAGSPYAYGSPPAYAAWTAATRETGQENLFVGATLVVGEHQATILAYQPKGSPGGHGDLGRFLLTAPWAGPTQTFVPYRVEFPAETDEAYTARQLYELVRPRENNLALAELIRTDTGVIVEDVRDLQRDLFIPSETPVRGRFLPGKKYTAMAAEVMLRDFPTLAAIEAARANVAAGVAVFVLGTFRMAALSPSSLTFRTRRLIIGPVPAMEIGVGAIGAAKIGPP